MTHPLRSTVVVGAGAVGSFYGAMLARAGHAVTLIGRAPHVQAIAERGLRLHMRGQIHAVSLAASTDLAAASGADLVLFCVKSPDTDAVARQLAPLLKPDALVISLQNGVDNAETLARHLTQAVVPAAVYVATAMPAPGEVHHHGQGHLVIGPINAAAAADAALMSRLHSVVDLFASAEVSVRVSPEVFGELWRKLIVNCAYNAVSGLTRQPYGRMADLPAIVDLQRAVVREVVAVARAAGQTIDLDASMAAMAAIATTMPGQRSSTAQDMARGRPTEIDHLNGFVVRRGAELGVPTPLNHALHALVKLVDVNRDAA
jgi:2-dehydropantoate 2-reductase